MIPLVAFVALCINIVHEKNMSRRHKGREKLDFEFPFPTFLFFSFSLSHFGNVINFLNIILHYKLFKKDYKKRGEGDEARLTHIPTVFQTRERG